MQHLGVNNGEDFVYADVENATYDNLDLNSSFVTAATAFAFKDRIFGGKMGEIYEALGKWKDAIYIPPKSGQAFNQGGTFILNNERVVFAHYDEAVGAHVEHDFVIEFAINEASRIVKGVL